MSQLPGSDYNTQSRPYTQTGRYSHQDKKLIHCIQEQTHVLKKLHHQFKRANRLLEFNLYIRLMEIAREREDVLDYDWTAIMRGLEPQKRKRKKHISSALERWWLG